MKVKVLSFFFGKCPYLDLFLNNITEYCNKWGYDFELVRSHEDYDGNPFISDYWFWWGNVTLIEKYLNEYDYVFWIDTDCIVLNMNIPIPQVCGQYDIALTKEVHPETGCFIVKNSEWSKWFIKLWKHHGIRLRLRSWHPADANNYLVLCAMLRETPYENNIRYCKNTEFMIKHVNIYLRQNETFVMHVPGSPFEDKVFYMTNHLKEVLK